ncbi:hypothetical protein OROHE_018464 [Orobanche hederae]
MASNLLNDFLPADHQQRTKLQKKNRRKKNKNSKNRSSSKATPGRFDFSTLLNICDPNIEKLAEQLQDDPSNSRDRKYASTMQQIAENLDFQTMATRLSYALMQDPSMSSMLEIYTNPPIQGRRNLRKLRTRHLNKDLCLKLILDKIENGGPAVMMRYWNDEKVLKMFGLVMGIRPYFADAVASFENYDETGDMGNEDSKNSGSDVTEDMESEDDSTDHSYYGYVTEEDMENEDESTVHSKNSGSDVTEDMENEHESTVHSKNSGSDVTEDMENEDESTVHSKNSGSNVTEDMENEDESTVHHIAVVDGVEESIHEEHSLLEFMLKLNLVDLLFRRMPREPVGYMRAQTRRVKSSSTSAHNLPYQETQATAGWERGVAYYPDYNYGGDSFS